MATYAAVISLKQTIEGLQNSSDISPVIQKILKSAHNQTKYLQQVLEQLNYSSKSTERLEAQKGQIRDCAHKLEDVLEFHELNPQEEKVRQEIASFSETLKKIEQDYFHELSMPVTNCDNVDDDDVSSNIDFGVEMVGNSEEFNSILNELLDQMRPDDLWFVSFFGEKGSGRTIATKNLFDDLRKGSEQFFDCCAWVTIGMKHELKNVLIRILAQIDNLAAIDYEMLVSTEDDELCKYLYKKLEHQRYIIVLDDVWDVQMVESVRRSLPDKGNGSLVLVITNSNEVAELTNCTNTFVPPESYFVEGIWLTLRSLLFGTDSISEEFEEAGRKILQSCQGRVVVIAKVIHFISTSEITLEQWRKIAVDEENPIFMVEDEISEINKLKISCKDNRLRNYISILTEYYGLEETKMEVHPDRFFSKMQIISLLGMSGIGKSMVARNVYQDKSIVHHFDHHVWITLGPNYETRDILIDILCQIYPDIDKLHAKEDDKLVRELCGQLSSKRCLIVLE